MVIKLIIALFCLVPFRAVAEEPAQIVWEGGSERLVLSPSLKDYLTKNFPNFKILTKADKVGRKWYDKTPGDRLPPVVAIGDFNGDGKKDVSLYLENSSKGIAVAFHAKGGQQWEHYQLESISLNKLDWCGMDVSHNIPPEKSWPNGINDAIVFSNYETGMQIFYWGKTRYHSYLPGD